MIINEKIEKKKKKKLSKDIDRVIWRDDKQPKKLESFEDKLVDYD